MSELCLLSALEQKRLLARREVSATELVQAHLAQIDRCNPTLNAVVTRCDEQALAEACALDARLAAGEGLHRPLAGLTVVVKDLFQTKGVRTTFGSPIHADFVPDEDRLIVARERQAGAIMLGKSNTPEFGAGAQTFNAVFGATGNPYDPALTCGGSSGGSAVALACGMAALADGSDTGGSLRAPAAWCNVVGMRPSPGRVPTVPSRDGWNGLSVDGPMARTVADLALFMSAIAGPDPRSPISIDESGERFTRSLDRDFKNVRVAFSYAHAQLPVDPEVVAVFEAARPVLASIGLTVVDDCPDFNGAAQAYTTLRAAKFALDREDDLKHNRHLLKQTIIDNAQAGMALSALDVMQAQAARTEIWRRQQAFMSKGGYAFLITPVNPVSPFPIAQQTLMQVGDVPLQRYTDWGALRYFISLLELPAISVPGGFTANGLPAGLQIVGRPRADFEVMQLAHAFEAATGFWQRRPPLAAGRPAAGSP